MRGVNTFIGSPVERVEDLRFLRGRGQYLDDLTRAGEWHAAIVRMVRMRAPVVAAVSGRTFARWAPGISSSWWRQPALRGAASTGRSWLVR